MSSQHSAVSSQQPAADLPALAWEVIEAACAFLDADFEEDCSGEFERLERAVAAYRKHLRRVRPCQDDLKPNVARSRI